MNKLGGYHIDVIIDHLVPQVLFYVFGASGASYYFRSPWVRLRRFPSNTFSENSLCVWIRDAIATKRMPLLLYLLWDLVVGMAYMLTFQSSCLRFPCFTHFALCTALSRSRNRHVESAYALFVFPFGMQKRGWCVECTFQWFAPRPQNTGC